MATGDAPRVVVTGATGFLGGYLLNRLAGTRHGLVRGRDGAERLAATAPDARPVHGDLLEGPIHLPDAEVLVHCAAAVSFTQPLADARAINVGGTERVLDAASRMPSLQRLVHVSTAYVAGSHAGRFGEDDLHVGQRFRNTYEQTKHEAERVVRASGLPWRIVRPSIVVGESTTGWTSAFNVLYPPLRALARGVVDEVTADPAAIVDVVPVDHVADVVEAAFGPGPDTLHAVAGDGALGIGELVALAARELGVPAPRLGAAAGTPLGNLDVYAPYFTVRTRFDAANARSAGLRPPALEAYFGTLMDYARRHDWGRVRRARSSPAARAAGTAPAS